MNRGSVNQAKVFQDSVDLRIGSQCVGEARQPKD
jgi:hypothetical protein